jgi:hypothetical protein
MKIAFHPVPAAMTCLIKVLKRRISPEVSKKEVTGLYPG